jgi:glutathione S-transferase
MLNESNLPHRRVEVDFTDLPEWIIELAPERKVPLLVVESRTLFESGAIVEYINDLTDGRYFALSDLVQRGVARSWCFYIERTHDEVRRYFTAPDEVTLNASHTKIRTRLEALMVGCPVALLPSTGLSMVGVYLAVLLMLLDVLECGPHQFVDDGSDLYELKQTLMALPSVQSVNTAEYRNRFLRFLCAKSSVFAVSDALIPHRLKLSTQFLTHQNTERSTAQYLSSKSKDAG